MNGRLNWKYGSLLSVALILLHSGCGGAGGKPPRKTVPVTGTIKVNGKPTAGVKIRLVPTKKENDGAGGVADDKGQYKLFMGATEGAMPGSYKVVFEYYVGKDGAPLVLKEGLDVEQLKMSGDAVSALPDNNTNYEMSTDTLDVPEDKPVTKDWELKTK